MDIIQDWTLHFLSSHEALRAYAPYIGRLYGYLTFIRTQLKTYLYPLITSASTKPDLATIALLLIILFVSLKLLNMLYQTVVFWVRLAWRVLWWATLGGLALWMYTRGPEGVVEDCSYWAGVWKGDYEYWRERESVGRLTGQKARNQAWF